MKKRIPATRKTLKRDAMRAEYRFDYDKAKPNRFAAKMSGASIAVIDPDVLDVFPDSNSVNRALRALAPVIRQQRNAPAKSRNA